MVRESGSSTPGPDFFSFAEFEPPDAGCYEFSEVRSVRYFAF